jgi:uncharacterized protein YkwD
MRPIIVIPLLALFAVPSGINLLSHDPVSLFNPSPSVPITAVRAVSNEPSRVATTAPEKPASSPSRSVAAVAATVPSAPPTAKTAPTPTPEPTPASPVPAPEENDFAAEVEAEILRLTNEERTKEGLSSLSADTKLRDVAAAHSADMLANDYFDHDNLQGCGSSCRATNAGYRWKSIGENIYMMSGYKLTPEKAAAKVVDGWMNSPGHKKNILGGTFTESGVGVVYGGKSIYVTSLYAKPR